MGSAPAPRCWRSWGGRIDCARAAYFRDRRWLPEDKRAEARAMRLKLAEDGVRYPVEVIAGNHRLMPGTCPWWDAAVGVRKAG